MKSAAIVSRLFHCYNLFDEKAVIAPAFYVYSLCHHFIRHFYIPTLV